MSFYYKISKFLNVNYWCLQHDSYQYIDDKRIFSSFVTRDAHHYAFWDHFSTVMGFPWEWKYLKRKTVRLFPSPFWSCYDGNSAVYLKSTQQNPCDAFFWAGSARACWRRQVSWVGAEGFCSGLAVLAGTDTEKGCSDFPFSLGTGGQDSFTSVTAEVK